MLKTKKRSPKAPLGADDEARTRYLHLGKVALYQMSYIRMSTTHIITNLSVFVNTLFYLFFSSFALTPKKKWAIINTYFYV